jgi:hypothetical protein
VLFKLNLSGYPGKPVCGLVDANKAFDYLYALVKLGVSCEMHLSFDANDLVELEFMVLPLPDKKLLLPYPEDGGLRKPVRTFENVLSAREVLLTHFLNNKETR